MVSPAISTGRYRWIRASVSVVTRGSSPPWPARRRSGGPRRSSSVCAGHDPARHNADSGRNRCRDHSPTHLATRPWHDARLRRPCPRSREPTTGIPVARAPPMRQRSGEIARGSRLYELAIPDRMSRIVVAEDDPAFRRLIASALRMDGFDVLEVRDGRELLSVLGAIVLFDDDLRSIDLIISDVRMPRM